MSRQGLLNLMGPSICYMTGFLSYGSMESGRRCRAAGLYGTAAVRSYKLHYQFSCVSVGAFSRFGVLGLGVLSL